MFRILNKINFNVHQGEMVSIIGPSGSGKTTFMMILSGIEKITKGLVEVDGTNISELSEDELAQFRREHVGIVFQNFHLIPNMTALENVAVALELCGSNAPFKEAKEELIEVGLKHRLDHYPDQLSGGEQQRVALARAFCTKPKILLADEPTGNLDKENCKHVRELLLELKKRHGSTLVFITHDPDMVHDASRHFIMKNGKLHESKS